MFLSHLIERLGVPAMPERKVWRCSEQPAPKGVMKERTGFSKLAQ